MERSTEKVVTGVDLGLDTDFLRMEGTDVLGCVCCLIMLTRMVGMELGTEQVVMEVDTVAVTDTARLEGMEVM